MNQAPIPWWYNEIGAAEKAGVLSCFEARTFSLGPEASALESDLAERFNAADAVVTNSGTSALTMAMLAAGVGPGDEVVVPALTWIASAQAAALLGAKVVLVDCLPDIPVIDPDAVSSVVTEETAAIVPVHLNGRPCNLDALKPLADAVGAWIVEDTCKGMASRTESGFLGTLANMGCFSMGMISLISVGYGGFLLTQDECAAATLRSIRDHGVIRSPESYRHLGSNFKISDMLAAVGRAQLAALDKKIDHVVQVYRRYRDGLSDLASVDVMPIDVESGKIPIYTELRSKRREDLAAFLADHAVQVSRWHLPLNTAAYLGAEGDFPNATALSSECMIIPSGPSQPLENVDVCIELIRQWDSKG